MCTCAHSRQSFRRPKMVGVPVINPNPKDPPATTLTAAVGWFPCFARERWQFAVCCCRKSAVRNMLLSCHNMAYQCVAFPPPKGSVGYKKFQNPCEGLHLLPLCAWVTCKRVLEQLVRPEAVDGGPPIVQPLRPAVRLRRHVHLLQGALVVSLEVFSASDASPVGHPGFKQQGIYGVWVRFFPLRKCLLRVPDCVLSLCRAGNGQASRM